jgi:hypothetical protein
LADQKTSELDPSKRIEIEPMKRPDIVPRDENLVDFADRQVFVVEMYQL